MRAIDADRLIAELRKSAEYHEARRLGYYSAITHIKEQPTIEVPTWIPVAERLPEEHESMFSKLYGTGMWDSAMYRTVSNDVLACIEHSDGTKMVKMLRTYSGEWRLSSIWNAKVTNWMPLPQPPKDGK